METILRSEEMAEIMLIPVRHHSPACSFQIQRVIADWKPDVIFIEGPDNANTLIPVMVHEETKAPFAIYYSYHDKEGRISEENKHYKCYYPFLEYSPELTALREAEKKGIDAAFIDLPYGDILAASKTGKGLLKEAEKNNYNDDYLLTRNEYIHRLCEKAGLRSFDEFWEKYFELVGLSEESDIWFSHLNIYCELARKNTPEPVLQEEGCLAREAHMAARIAQWVTEHALSGQKQGYSKVLTITGGFHTPALRERLSDEKWQETVQAGKMLAKAVQDEEQCVYLMPYSMEAADALNGYASGMPFAGFYQKIWEELCGGEESQPYQKAVLDFLVASGKKLRRKEGCLSTYDEICAWQMVQGLCELREKPQPGAYELLDAVLSSYVKGEYNLATDMPMRIVRKLMIGNGSGTLCAQADVPPIIHDFEAQCRAFGLKSTSTLETEVTLSVFSGRKHRQTSMFFHRMCFLNSTFARRIKGPNLQLKKDKNLLREIWKYKWSAQVHAALIDVSVHGATIEEASVSLVQEQMKKDIGAGQAALLLTQVFEMGLGGELEPMYDRVQELMIKDTDFYSIAEAVKALMMMEELESLYDTRLALTKPLHMGVCKLIMLLPSMTGISDEKLEDCMHVLKLLYQITGRKEDDFAKERESYYEALDKMQKDSTIHAGLEGCIHGILYGSGRETTKVVETICKGYLTGTKDQILKTAVFFRGLFYTARDIVFIGEDLLKMLDTFLGQVDKEAFMELLPQLRMAFAYFTPTETDRIAQNAAGLHGKQRADIMERGEILPEWYAYGRELDDYVSECYSSS